MKATQQWIVCVGSGSTGSDSYIGPFRTQEGASRVAKRLRRDLAAIGVDEAHDCPVTVEPTTPGHDIEAFREALLRDWADA